MTVLGQHPQRLDLYIHPGDVIDFGVPVLDAVAAAVDISLWTCAAVVLGPGGETLHDFAPSIADGLVRVAATAAQTGAWEWSAYAARLVVTATPPTSAPMPILTGWIRLYRP